MSLNLVLNLSEKTMKSVDLYVWTYFSLNFEDSRLFDFGYKIAKFGRNFDEIWNKDKFVELNNKIKLCYTR